MTPARLDTGERAQVIAFLRYRRRGSGPHYAAKFLDRLHRPEQAHTTSGQDSFFHGGASCMHRIVDPILSLLHLDFRGAAHADHRHPARELGDPLLELIPVVV